MGLLRTPERQVRLVVGTPLGQFIRSASRAAWRSRRAMARDRFGLSIIRIPTLPARLDRSHVDGVVMSRWLAAQLDSSEPAILHCRGLTAAQIGLTVRTRRPGVRVVFDCRGVAGPEALYAGGFPSEDGAPVEMVAVARNLDTQQKAAAKASDGVIVVSHAMRELALRSWGVPTGRVAVTPCCAEVDESALRERDGTRDRLGVKDRFVVVYCGSITPYQMVEESVDLFREILTMRPDATFLGITPSVTLLTELLRARGVPSEKFQIISAPHSEVPKLLAAGDLAVLLRERSLVNAVASPVKFAEYLAAGIPVVLTEGIGDYSDLVRSNGVGCVLPDVRANEKSHDDLNAFLIAYSRNAPDVRANCYALARRELSAARARDAVNSLYHRLFSEARSSETSLFAANAEEKTVA